MPDSKPVRIDLDLIPIIREYSDGSISDGIRAMHNAAKEKGPASITLETVKIAVREVLLEQK